MCHLIEEKRVKTGELSVLIVDDQVGVRRLIMEILKEDGYEIFQAESGETALTFVSADWPGVILLDMKMPGMNGLEVLQELKKISYNGSVILMTAYGELELINKANKLGVMHFLTKPFDINELRLLVREVFQQEIQQKARA